MASLKLPTQLVVRDRRYRRSEIVAMCQEVGLEVIWTSFLQAGHWDSGLDAHDQRGQRDPCALQEARRGAVARIASDDLMGPGRVWGDRWGTLKDYISTGGVPSSSLHVLCMI